MADKPFDRIVAFLFRESGDELVLTTGKRMSLRSAGTERAVLAQMLRTAQIENLLKDVAPPSKGNTVTVPYQSTLGEVTVTVERTKVRVTATIRRKVAESPVAGSSPKVARAPKTGAEKAGSTSVVDDMMRAFVSGASDSPPPPAPPTPPAVAVLPETFGAPLAPEPEPVAAPRPVPRPTPAPIAPSTAVDDDSAHAPFEFKLDLDTGDVPARPTAESKLAGISLAPPPPAANGSIRFAPVAQGARAKIDALLEVLVRAKASDLHLTSGLKPKMRLDGEIVDVPGGAVVSSDYIEELLMQIAPVSTQQKFYESNDADYAYEIEGLSRFRVNAFRDRRGVGGVLRVIPSKILSFEQLNLPPVCLSFCRLSKGLVVVTGPTGSGKSTTLAAMVDWINTNRKDHLITIEDPVEFVHPPKSCLINQREVHTHTKSFSAALRAALREDPDIVLVGELRDLETVSIAIETAETGHLVFGTLHTNTAISTVDRIIDQFPTDQQSQVRVMLSESLKGVVAQTLCKKIGGGRVAALEVLVVVPAVANLIREGKTFQITSIMQTGRNLGMQLLNDAFMNLVRDGKIEPQEAYNRAVQKTELKALLERAGHKVEG